MSSLSNLINFVQQKYPGLREKDSYDAIVGVKETNGGQLKGLNKSSFLKLLDEFMSKKTLGDDEKQGEVETKEEKKTCKICFRVLSSAQAVRRHSRKCKAETYFPRDENDNNDTIEVENVHQDDHSKDDSFANEQEPEFVCKVCGKIYRHKTSLARHLKDHEDNLFDCDECSKRFSRKDNLYAHKRVVHNRHFLNFDAIKKFYHASKSCRKCGENLESKEEFEAHITLKICQDRSKKLELEQDEKFKCCLCDKSYKSKKNLVAHIKWKHSTQEKKVFSCNICEKNFSYKCLLRRHNQKNHGQNKDDI